MIFIGDIMGRNIKSNRTGYYIRAKVYPSSIDDNNEVVRKLDYVTPKIFYAKDYQDLSLEKSEFDGVSQRMALKGTIQTMDLSQGDIKIHDTVEYGGIKYDVVNVVFADCNAQKSVSRRPEVKTIITLGATLNV